MPSFSAHAQRVALDRGLPQRLARREPVAPGMPGNLVKQRDRFLRAVADLALQPQRDAGRGARDQFDVGPVGDRSLVGQQRPYQPLIGGAVAASSSDAAV